MASSPVTQLPTTSVDLYGASTATSPRSAGDPRAGALYDNTVLAAGAPIHFHPVSPTKFLVAFSETWAAATPAPTQPGFYSSYTPSTTPTWYIADQSGSRTLVGSSAVIPVQTPNDSVFLVAGASRAPDLIYLLHTLTKSGTTTGLVQLFRFSVTSRVLPADEELIPNLDAAGVTFNAGLAFTTPNLTAFGTDESGNVFMARKPWSAIGSNSSKSAKTGLTTDLSWQYGTGTGWSPDPTEAAPEPGIKSYGPVSYARFRKTIYLATTQRTGSVYSAQVYAQKFGQSVWKPLGDPVALGSSADGSYLGGTLQLQSMLGATASMVQGPASETAFPFCTSVKSRVSSQDKLAVTWGLLQVPRQT